MWWALPKHNVVTSVRTGDSETDTFPITIVLYYRSALNPYIFSLVKDEVPKDIQADIS
jgi:hypothetical protein